jgi:hypothetical protein
MGSVVGATRPTRPLGVRAEVGEHIGQRGGELSRGSCIVTKPLSVGFYR